MTRYIKYTQVTKIFGVASIIGLLIVTILVGRLINVKVGNEYYENSNIAQEPKDDDGVPIEFPEQYNQEDVKNSVNRMVFNAIQNLQAPRRGAAGAQGPQGVQGPPGGPNIATGVPLRNVSTKAVCQKLSGTGERAQVMLSQQDYTREQAWVLKSNNQLINLSGSHPSCMTASDSTKKVFMDKCATGNYIPRAQQWRMDGTGRVRWLQPSEGKQMCLEAKPSVVQGVRKVGDTGSAPAPPIDGNFLFIAPCGNNNPNQLFSFS